MVGSEGGGRDEQWGRGRKGEHRGGMSRERGGEEQAEREGRWTSREGSASGASGITRLGRGTGTALAVNCPWAVNGGRIKLVRRVAIEDEGLTMYAVYDDDDNTVVVVCISIPPTSLARRLSSFAALETVGHAHRPFVTGRGRWRVWWVLLFVRGLLLHL